MILRRDLIISACMSSPREPMLRLLLLVWEGNDGPCLLHLCVILHIFDACLPRTIGAAIEGGIRLDTMSDDLASAVITNRGKFVYRTLETVERMTRARRYDLERQIIIVPAHFTFRHGLFLLFSVMK